jgi:hypothetical protein
VRPAVGAVTLAVLLLIPGVVRAHPLVDEARRLVDLAQFQEALAALDRAAAVEDLTRAELIVLLETRAVAHLALDDRAALGTTVAQLAAIEPEHRFAPSMPPDVVTAFAAARAASDPLQLELTLEDAPGGVRIEAQARNDRTRVVRRVRIHARIGEGEWQSHDGAEHTVEAASGEAVEARAIALGPGGATVAEAGSEAQPFRHVVPGSEILAVDDGSDDEGGGVNWLWVGVGAAAAVLAVVVVGIAASGGPDGTESSDLYGPTIPGF